MKHTFESFVNLVQKSRIAATRYYELSARAKKTKHPDDFKSMRDGLAIAKELEGQVDAACIEIKQMLAVPDPEQFRGERPAIVIEPLS